MEKPRLLVVDNEIDICNFVKMFFELRGFEVSTALNGDEAMARLADKKPEVVLLDIRMRWENEGLEYLPQIKVEIPQSQIILVTGIEDAEVSRRARALGAERCVLKPLMLEDLENVVIQKHRARMAAYE